MTDAIRTTTQIELLRRAAFRLGDLVMLSPTDGSVNTATDAVNLLPGNEDFYRRQVVNPATGEVAVVTAHSQDTSTITFTPAMNDLPAALYVVNKRGTGFNVNEFYLSAQMAQDDAYPLARTTVEGSTSTFDYSSPTIAIPSGIKEVVDVLYLDDEGDWYPINKATRMAYPGWQANKYDGQIVVNGPLRDAIHGFTVKVIGEGRETPMTTYNSTTQLHPDWVVSRMCYHLCFLAMDRDATGLRKSQVLTFQQEAVAKEGLIRTRWSPAGATARIA